MITRRRVIGCAAAVIASSMVPVRVSAISALPRYPLADDQEASLRDLFEKTDPWANECFMRDSSFELMGRTTLIIIFGTPFAQKFVASVHAELLISVSKQAVRGVQDVVVEARKDFQGRERSRPFLLKR